ncbi:flavin-containing monooxygenase [Nocardioides sp. Leaf374]|uniref:flavin-containing monooxygenase n=1 Tax=Nocardioides sp. Leaf374 TaxID=2876560 RepID=UPI001E2F95A7|nr:NAD(P)/FAD-dependent oxidoreductase [Nocardioides sp. Leaf374]
MVTPTPAQGPRAPRAPRAPRVLVVGAGFGGLGVVRALRERGLNDVTVLERAEAAGGVWRDNTYPGAACDVPSPLYSWSWAVKTDWQHRYGTQPEILAYLRETAAREGLLDHVETGRTVTSLRWSEDTRSWAVATAEGATYEADVVVTATGQLSEPVVPDLPGADSFAGPSFHSAQWRHDVDLTGKRVAVVGTGASAIQFVPGIVDRVGALTVFQRSAPYVVPKPDQEWGERHHRVFDRVPALMGAERRSWFWLTERLNAALVGESPLTPAINRGLRAVWRLHLRRQVRDAALRARLVPDYPIGCKRLLFSNDWYPALDRDHVEVVDTAVAGVEPTGVRTADGVLHEVDVVIWGTGFAATRFLDGVEVVGPGGRTLAEQWRGGARAHLGVGVAGFPNLFCVYGPNTNLGGSSIITMMEAQAGWIAQVARGIADGRARGVAPRAEVYDAYDEEMQTRLARSAWAGCSSWYVEGGRISTNWPGRVQEYQERTARVDWSQLEDVS